MELYDILRRPLITEKSTALQAQGEYAFEVAKGSNKAEIKAAVQKTFKVTVTSVNVITVRGRIRKLGRRTLPAQPWKKAIVTLKEGDKIEFFEGAQI